MTQFTDEYLWDLLRFIVQDKNGEKVLKKIDDDYFNLIEHQVIANALIKFYKKENRIPGETILRERVLKLLTSKNFVDLVRKSEQKDIINLLKPLYSQKVLDGDIIYNECKRFSIQTKFRRIIEDIDIDNTDKYENYIGKLQRTIMIDEDEIEEMKSSFLLGDVKRRQRDRQIHNDIFPTPFRQINDLTNAGGYEAGSVMVILDKQKRGKTAMLVNVARGYLKMRKKILYLDLENGKKNIFSRLEQSIMNLEKMQIRSGEFDDKTNKRFRKYARFGGEIIVERLPALVSTANTIQNLIDNYYNQYGISFDVIIIDYAAKLASISGKDDERNRISDVYIEIDNLAKKNNIEAVWTANHVTREAAKSRMKTRYVGEDIANCIDIVRHAQAVFGLNRSPEEEEANFFRLEVVEQRDGLPHGRAVFTMNMKTQRADELSKAHRKQYDDEFYSKINLDDDGDSKTVSKKRKNDYND